MDLLGVERAVEKKRLRAGADVGVDGWLITGVWRWERVGGVRIGGWDWD